MTKAEINIKRQKDLFYKTRKMAFKQYKKLGKTKECYKHYDLTNKLMVQYELI